MLPRFYYPEILKGNNQISNKTHVHHICKVLRLKKNDYIQLKNFGFEELDITINE